MLKICIAIFLFASPIWAQVSEQNLGSVVAVERNFKLQQNSILNQLKPNSKQTQWTAKVEESTDSADVISTFSASNDFLYSTDKVTLVFTVQPYGYSMSASGKSGKAISRADVETALQTAFNELGLTNKLYFVRFLKIAR